MTTNLPWTPESAAYAAKLYESGHSITAIAEALDRTDRSIISKFTQLGLYKAAPRPAREPTKAELVGELCHRLGLDPTKTYTLTAASHEALVEILRATAP
jgi:transposase